MRNGLLTLIPLLLVAQTVGLAVPFRYCFDDGELCCTGRAAETCCDHACDPKPGLIPGETCSYVEADVPRLLAAASPRVAPADLAPTPGAVLPSPVFSPSLRILTTRATPTLPHLATTVLRR